jgi:hypothetical protein
VAKALGAEPRACARALDAFSVKARAQASSRASPRQPFEIRRTEWSVSI